MHTKKACGLFVLHKSNPIPTTFDQKTTHGILLTKRFQIRFGCFFGKALGELLVRFRSFFS